MAAHRWQHRITLQGRTDLTGIPQELQDALWKHGIMLQRFCIGVDDKDLPHQTPWPDASEYVNVPQD